MHGEVVPYTIAGKNETNSNHHNTVKWKNNSLVGKHPFIVFYTQSKKFNSILEQQESVKVKQRGNQISKLGFKNYFSYFKSILL